MPCRSDFSDDDLRPWFGNLLMVDVVEGPHKFRFRLMGTSLVDAACRELTGKFFDEADISGYEPDVLDDYAEVLQDPHADLQDPALQSGARDLHGALAGL